ncbi:type II toxin-antitoxin system YafQ family toxin [Bartonella sp. AU55XJBT]|uniref:type II toxin-antitoxin system YafQ family toxin n=1 Tax=Bartonella sp. AU55XJBT TaxID=3019091 RepID=UPI002362DDEE|nr:type II toxin-antitoxin system YafQ family toxin [Bartonella sp. AU55XJBT]
MRTIERTTIFKRDFKREMKGRHRHLLDTDLRTVIAALANDQPLEFRYRDHALTGSWSNYRDYHIRPDLVLIYRFVDQDRLVLVRLGSHSQLDL